MAFVQHLFPFSESRNWKVQYRRHSSPLHVDLYLCNGILLRDNLDSSLLSHLCISPSGIPRESCQRRLRLYGSGDLVYLARAANMSCKSDAADTIIWNTSSLLTVLGSLLCCPMLCRYALLCLPSLPFFNLIEVPMHQRAVATMLVAPIIAGLLRVIGAAVAQARTKTNKNITLSKQSLPCAYLNSLPYHCIIT